ncbi:hypothetical protein [Parabacteroides pacaensis]|uniref:hypothetical protein n=1 Tax=Parabacteroides pacaensis TaxID=2086575 RepID=UPI000D0FCE6F|nr:hypothetical protein [Parabacteroides pacaensis]
MARSSSDESKTTESREITQRFIDVMYQLIGMRKIKSKRQFGEVVGIPSNNIYRMETEQSMNVPLYALKRAVEAYNINLYYVITGKGQVFL